ncbi:hypothetical protein BPO_0378 [Bergeyella porcorum]|uniref:Uncharacterized protein n=1 Tax=Bergeyella porcorum TaxID=1735111 RepID=A0AAU0F4Z9_9FLAO
MHQTINEIEVLSGTSIFFIDKNYNSGTFLIQKK